MATSGSERQTGTDRTCPHPPRPPLRHYVKICCSRSRSLGLHVWAWRGIEMEVALMFNSAPHMADFLIRMMPPDWSVLPTVLHAVARDAADGHHRHHS
jgi:ABC-type phosphate/phosphonate transport system permease subunit